MSDTSRNPRSAFLNWLDESLAVLAISYWVGSLFVQTIGTVIALCCLPSKLAVLYLAWQVLEVVRPVGPTPKLVERFLKFSVQSATKYFSLKVVCEDQDAIQHGQTYVVGLEPHSALPTALPMMFNRFCEVLPSPLRDIKILATSVAFYMPATKHLWWGLGIRPIDKRSFGDLLKAKTSVVLVPGGLSECMIMKKGQEAMYLRKRLGFVKLALQHGAHLLPAFAFGQSDTYSWYRPGPPLVPVRVVDAVRKVLGFVPLTMWGRFGTPVPHKVPMMVVFGKPIVLPKLDDPSQDEIRTYLNLYITAIEGICERYKHQAGYGDTIFKVL